MVQARGEKLQNVHQRIAPKIATTTLLAATDPRGPYRVDGILCPVDDLSLWRFDATSTDAASATVIVPDSGAGR
ncbi:MAG: hypothetical protein GWN58_57375, partial [Anaerolineae bacterium]|nr:hypothetical protein [Anaerolineae bacterium]